MGFYIIAATAGHDTTSNTTASAMVSVAERPELLAQIQPRIERALLAGGNGRED